MMFNAHSCQMEKRRSFKHANLLHQPAYQKEELTAIPKTLDIMLKDIKTQEEECNAIINSNYCGLLIEYLVRFFCNQINHTVIQSHL